MWPVMGKSRALAMGIVFAAAGFCLAISNYDKESQGVAARGVGTSLALRFTNPAMAGAPTEYDLGDAAYGSSVTRYITAEGGLKPYRFTSEEPLSLADAIAGYQTTLALGLSGVLSGNLPPVGTVVANRPHIKSLGVEGFQFQVTARDGRSIGSGTLGIITGIFDLRLYDSAKVPFRFAMDKIPGARLGASYLTTLDTVGGQGTKTYSVVSIINTGTGLPVLMNNLGLYVSADGAITGCPLLLGTFTLTVRCTDSRHQIALNRAGAAKDQAFTLTVLDQPITSSELTTLMCRVRGNLLAGGHDVLQYTGVLNTMGLNAKALLNSAFSFRFGGLLVSGRLNRTGYYTAMLADQSIVKVNFHPVIGTVTVAISYGSFSTALSAATLAKGLTREPVEVTLGSAVACSEIIDLNTRVGDTRYELDYLIGNQGARRRRCVPDHERAREGRDFLERQAGRRLAGALRGCAAQPGGKRFAGPFAEFHQRQ